MSLTMNTTQLKYALTKATAAYNKKFKELTEKHTTPAVHMTQEERRVAITVRRFNLDEDKGRERFPRKGNGGYWVDVLGCYIVFNDESPEVVSPKLAGLHERLTRQYEDLKDKLYLGDGSEAMKLLEAFAGASA